MVSRGDCDASGVTPPLPWTVAIAVSWSWTADTRLSLEGGGADGAHFLASPSPLSRHHFFHMGLRARLLQLCRLITCTCVYLTLWLLDAGAAGQRPYPLPTSPPNHRMVNQGLSGSWFESIWYLLSASSFFRLLDHHKQQASGWLCEYIGHFALHY